MQYDVKTPKEYFEVLEDDWRLEKLKRIRTIILDKGPDLEEAINYKMLGYADQRGIIFHLNAQKNYVALYVGNASKVDPEGSLLQGIDCGKGCIRIKKSTQLENTRLDEFIERAIRLWKEGVDIDC